MYNTSAVPLRNSKAFFLISFTPGCFWPLLFAVWELRADAGISGIVSIPVPLSLLISFTCCISFWEYQFTAWWLQDQMAEAFASIALGEGRSLAVFAQPSSARRMRKNWLDESAFLFERKVPGKCPREPCRCVCVSAFCFFRALIFRRP